MIRRLRGFTLVEVLVAMVLLSLLMLALTGALRAMGQTEERVEQRVAAADDYRAAVNLLNDVLGQVSARRFPSQQAGTPPQMPFFQATPDALAWVGVMPARYGLGGRHYLRLAVEPGEGGADRRLAEEQLFRRAGHAALVHQRLEHDQQVQVDTAQVVAVHAQLPSGNP